MLGLLAEILKRLTPKKSAPVKVPIRYLIQRDIYTDMLLAKLDENTLTVDADMYDKL